MKQNRPRVLRACKVCGKEFLARHRDIERGKAKFCSQKCWLVHKSTNNALVPCKCETCGKKFRLYQSWVDRGIGKFCSNECSAASRTKTVTCKCNRCGKEFEAWPSKARKAKFCSRECSSKGQGHKKRPAAKRFVCQACGKVFIEKLGRERVYCSNKCCTHAFRKSDKKSTDRRGKDYAKWALAVMKRDKRCVRCGATEKLQAHHIKHWKEFTDHRYDMDNGVALCIYCHHAQHPSIPLEKFVALGGASVRYCVLCEGAYVSRRKQQRTCSRTCGNRLRRQTAAAMGRRPA